MFDRVLDTTLYPVLNGCWQPKIAKPEKFHLIIYKNCKKLTKIVDINTVNSTHDKLLGISLRVKQWILFLFTKTKLEHNFIKYVERFIQVSLREMCTYSEFFWSAFSRIQTIYGEIWSNSPYSVRMRENTDQKNSEYGHFSHSVCRLHMSLSEQSTIFESAFSCFKLTLSW